jgi:hypothetical protein
MHEQASARSAASLKVTALDPVVDGTFGNAEVGRHIDDGRLVGSQQGCLGRPGDAVCIANPPHSSDVEGVACASHEPRRGKLYHDLFVAALV